MKILIAGDGKLGMTLARQLSGEGHDITLIDTESSVLEASVDLLDIMAVQGNCITMDTLQNAEVKDADLLIAATGTDEVNLLCCVTAHGMNPELHTIARIRNPEYTSQVYKMPDAFGLSMTVNPEKQAAIEIERLLKYPGFLKRDTFAKGRAEIVEMRVKASSPLCNLTLNSLNTVAKCNVLVCVVLRDGTALIPDGNFVLKEGDRIFVTAPTDNLSILLKNLGIVTHRAKRVVIAGGGKISFYLAQNLAKSGISVTVIEQNEDVCRELASLLPSTDIIRGDASSQELLESEGVPDCDAFIALTGLDELNMVLALYGNSFGVPQMITKLGRIDNPKVTDDLPLGSVISPRHLSCNNIVRYVRALQNKAGAASSIHFIADGKAEAIEFTVDDSTQNCKTPLKNIKTKKNVLIACITRGMKTMLPSGDSFFQKGDSVVIVSSGDTVIRQLNDIFA